MRTIKFSDWQQEKKSYLSKKARRLSTLSPKDRVPRRPIDANQAAVLRKADKARALQLEKEGKIIWLGPREVKINLK